MLQSPDQICFSLLVQSHMWSVERLDSCCRLAGGAAFFAMREWEQHEAVCSASRTSGSWHATLLLRDLALSLSLLRLPQNLATIVDNRHHAVSHCIDCCFYFCGSCHSTALLARSGTEL